jgi:hypothetical protein
MLTSLTTLLTSIVDYAGLFPPAKLEMREAMMEYLQCKTSPYCWMLGRFILPANRLSEFLAFVPALTHGNIESNNSAKLWPLSLVMPSNMSDGLALELERITSRILSSRSALSGEPLASSDVNQDVDIVALEFPRLPLTEVRQLLTQLPSGVDTFFELPLDETLEAYVTTLQGTGAFAKIRTGGITAGAFPDVHQISQFIMACARAHVPFKATAGLHHLLPGFYPMTYEPNSDSARMYGFLNVAIAASLTYCKTVTTHDVVDALQTASVDQFKLQSDGVAWKHYQLSLNDLQNTRKDFFKGFGSCSFKEPVFEIQNSKLEIKTGKTKEVEI